jgi:hypothetical protein
LVFTKGFRFSRIIEAAEGQIRPHSTTWEKTAGGYVLRWSKPDELQGGEAVMAIEFAMQPTKADELYQGEECGPIVIRAEQGLMNGKPVPDFLVSEIFEAAANLLQQAEPIAAPADGSPSQFATEDATATASDSHPRTGQMSEAEEQAEYENEREYYAARENAAAVAADAAAAEETR